MKDTDLSDRDNIIIDFAQTEMNNSILNSEY